MARDVMELELANIRRGVSSLVILHMLKDSPTYAYELAKKLRSEHPLLCPENDLYPTMKRLQRGGCVSFKWRLSPAGPPRKYYRLTRRGENVHQQLVETWSSLGMVLSGLFEQPA